MNPKHFAAAVGSSLADRLVGERPTKHAIGTNVVTLKTTGTSTVVGPANVYPANPTDGRPYTDDSAFALFGTLG